MVVKATIKAALVSLYNDARGDDPMSDDTFADRMADIVRNAILSAQVNSGITVTTPDTINGSTTGTGTLS